jgi:carbon monoxide dehydrogenase subunit G
VEFTGSQSIAAPRVAVWNALNDPAVLQRCLPGCQSIERTTGDEFRFVMLAAIGALRAKFNGILRLTEAQAPQSCVLVFEGKDPAMGFGKGTARVELQEVGNATELRYVAQAQLGGKLAQVGSRLIDNIARKISDDFFVAFNKQVMQPALIPALELTPALELIPALGSTPAPESAAASASGSPAAFSAPAPPFRLQITELVPWWAWLAIGAVVGATALHWFGGS